MRCIQTLVFLLFTGIVLGQGSLDYLETNRPIQEIVSRDDAKLIIGTTTIKGSRTESFLLIKKAAKGAELWSKTYGGTSYDRANDILETEDGGFLLLGSTSSYGAGNYDVLLIKIDKDGIQEWQKTYGEFHNDYADSFVQRGDDVIIIKAKKQFCDIKNDFSDCTYGDWYIEISERGEVIRERSTIFGEN